MHVCSAAQRDADAYLVSDGITCAPHPLLVLSLISQKVFSWVLRA